MKTRPARLTKADVWIFTAILIATYASGKWAPLPRILDEAEWLTLEIPSFDLLSYGLKRLDRAMLIEVQLSRNGLRAQPTREGHKLMGIALGRESKSSSRGEILDQMIQELGLTNYDEPLHEDDRSAGRLVGMTPQMVEAAVTAYRLQ